MRKVLAVLRREYLAQVRTKMFWIGTLGIPVGMIGIMVVSGVLAAMGSDKVRPIAVIDETGLIYEELVAGLEGKQVDGEAKYPMELIEPRGDAESMVESLKPRVLSDELYAILWIGPDLDERDNYQLYRRSVGDERMVDDIRNQLWDLVVAQRMRDRDLEIDRDVLDELTARVRIASFQVSKGGETKRKGFEAALLPTFFFVIILFMTIYMYGFAMARGVIQEKSGRVMEVLLGSLSPEQLMAGKVMGIGLVGLTQLGVYGSVGVGMRLAMGSFMSPEVMEQIPAELSTIIQELLSPERWIFFFIFFVLGYFLFTTLFAIVGAVCSTEQDAQQLQFPVMMCLMIPYMLTFFFVQQPDSLFATISSLIPFFTPMVMFMRLSVLTPPFWQIALSIVLTTATIWLMMRVAAKIFRIGTLMYGKPPTLPEIFRWARS